MPPFTGCYSVAGLSQFGRGASQESTPNNATVEPQLGTNGVCCIPKLNALRWQARRPVLIFSSLRSVLPKPCSASSCASSHGETHTSYSGDELLSALAVRLQFAILVPQKPAG